ncbi:MAG: hypothetical protein JSW50_03330, partial [Candidatus Latescibacterota bacterium]
MDPKDANKPGRDPLLQTDLDIVDETTLDDLDTEPMLINIGPTHPATHGTFRVFCRLDGEKIDRAAVEIGYL